MLGPSSDDIHRQLHLGQHTQPWVMGLRARLLECREGVGQWGHSAVGAPDGAPGEGGTRPGVIDPSRSS